MVDGKLVRRSPQAAGTGYMVSAYAKNPELAYLFIQWFTSPSIGDDAVAHPKGFWDPFRHSNLTHKGILDRFGEDMVKTTIENSKYAASLLLIEGNYEYFKILDNNLADVMNKNITAEEAAKRIEVELEQDHQRDRPRSPDPDLAQGRRERHLPRQVLSSRSPQPRSEPGRRRQHRGCAVAASTLARWREAEHRCAACSASTSVEARPAPAERRRRLARWLASERVFRLIPFLLVEALFVLDHPGPVRPDDLDQPAEVARQPSVRDGPLLRPRELRGGARRTISSGWRSGAPSISRASPSRSSWSSASCWRCSCRRCTRSRKLYTTIFLVPMMIVPIVVGYNFSMIYIDSGPLNQILAPFLERFGIDPRIRWLSHPVAAQWAIIIADVWQWTSLTFLIFLSGFAALPRQLVNAARVMGASPWQTFWRVELPLLKPAIVIAVIIRSMEALKLFDPVVLLTFGGPGTSTQTVAYFLWEQVWVFNKFSFGAAASILLLFIFSVLIFFGIYMLISQRRAVEGSAP